MEGSDFSFVGDSYAAPDPYQDSQACINYYVEVSQNARSKTPTALLGTPGLNAINQFSVVGPVRGCWVLPGGTQAVWISGNTAYIMTMTVPPTQNAIAQFSTAIIGTLLTNSGPVIIRDNGAGGYVVFVDGPYGYYYRIAGAGITTFTGTPTIGSVTLPYSGSLNSALIVGSVLSGTGIAVGATITAISASLGQITMSAAATSSPGAVTISVALAVFGRFLDAGFYGADRVAFIDGWLLFNKPGTQTFYTNSPVSYTLLFDPLFFALKDTSSDNLLTLMENNREAWLIGERTSEIWFDGGGAQFAFQRIPGAAPQVGCSAKHSIARLGSEIVWLARNEQGENIVVTTQQYTWKRISTHAIEHAIASYPLISDAVGYTYEEEGHLFYVLSFPTADTTWVYDATSEMWHQRLSYDQNLGVFHRHQSNCFCNFQNLRLVGDYQTGQVHQMSRAFFTDNGDPLIAMRRTPVVWSKENRQRVFFSSLQIEFAPGVGLQVGQGSNPQAMLKWSDDGGANYGTEHWRPIGKAGQTKNRAIWRRISVSRGRVFEMRYSDPTNRDIVGATLYASGSE
jgi:hypothetical protein